MKKYLSGLFAIMLALVLNSFTSPPVRHGSLEQQWFYLIPGGDPNVEEDYRPAPEQPCDGNTTIVCGVLATEDAVKQERPDLNQSFTLVYKEF